MGDENADVFELELVETIEKLRVKWGVSHRSVACVLRSQADISDIAANVQKGMTDADR